MALVNLFGIIAPCLNCCERLRYVKPTKIKKSKTKNKENIFDNKTNTTENIQVNDNVKEPFLQKDNNQNINDSNTIDNSNNISNNNINKDESYNDEKKGDNFSNVFGVKRDESNNTEGNK